MEQQNFVYMVRCRDGSLYTGWTNHLQKRIATHNTGKGSKYTASRLPVELVYFETFPTKQAAMSREYALKQLKRAEKLELIRHFDQSQLAAFSETDSSLA